MQFCQFDFIIFLLAVIVITYLCRNNFIRKIWLLLTSFFFYGYADWKLCLLLIVIIIITFVSSHIIHKSQHTKIRKLSFVASLILLLFILFIFKYYNFFIKNISLIFSNFCLSSHTLKLLLPIGLSFYIFQAISYITDVYRNTIKITPSFLDLSLFISFFPHLSQGPIVRADYFLPQLLKAPHFNKVSFLVGIEYLLFGTFQKVFIADRISYFVNEVFHFSFQYSALTLLLAAFAYTIQIYADFAGYSNMAIGISRLLGYHLPHNFNNPYISINISDFWRRWHITLSSWLRDYLYIPLGGSRKGLFRTCLNQMITMLLGGLWHGSNWNFVIWGGWHGLCLCIHKIFRLRFHSPKSRSPHNITNFISWHLTMTAVIIGWIFFRASSFTEATQLIIRIITMAQGITWIEPFVIFAILLVEFQQLSVVMGIYSKFLRPKLGTTYFWWLIFMMFFLSIIFQPSESAPFIYFQF